MNEGDLTSGTNQLLNKYKIPIGLSLLGLVLIFGGVFLTTNPVTQQASSFPKESIVNPSSEFIAVDISGAVKNAGVTKVSKDSRLEDVIKQSGGFTEGANQEYISKYLNLAQKVSDGMKIYIPFEGESAPVNMVGAVAGVSTAQVQLNINNASQSDLEALSGVGPVTAKKIIDSRPYQKIEDLVSKKILGKATFDKIKDSLVVN
jgi:competence protein ComEA